MAGRPKKDAQRLFYDEFYDMTIDEQAISLRILIEHHEYVKKRARNGKTKDAPEDAPQVTEAIA